MQADPPTKFEKIEPNREEGQTKTDSCRVVDSRYFFSRFMIFCVSFGLFLSFPSSTPALFGHLKFDAWTILNFVSTAAASIQEILFCQTFFIKIKSRIDDSGLRGEIDRENRFASAIRVKTACSLCQRLNGVACSLV